MRELRIQASLGLVALVFAGFLAGACQKAYYGTMEKLGVHKRDILIDRVEEARDSQTEAKDQFQDALERFSSLVNFKGGDLEAKYKDLKAVLDKSESKAEAVRKRIAAVEDVAQALFAEWESELKLYTSSNLRRSSETRLAQTRESYAKLIGAMKRAESKIDPVLNPLRDQVLFLKHNLNARAVASLQEELVSVEADIATLIQEMEAAIAEADAFIGELEKG
jgi:hypothetical protein